MQNTYFHGLFSKTTTLKSACFRDALKMNEYALKQNLNHFQPKKLGMNYVVTIL